MKETVQIHFSFLITLTPGSNRNRIESEIRSKSDRIGWYLRESEKIDSETEKSESNRFLKFESKPSSMYVGYGEPSTSTESLYVDGEPLRRLRRHEILVSVTPSTHNGDRKGCDWSSKNIISWSSKNEDQDDAMHDIYTIILYYYYIIICSRMPTRPT